MAVTLRDIARLAHVSASTVSRALRDHPHVSDATREAVVRVAEEMGYAMGNLRQVTGEAKIVQLSIHDSQSQNPQDILDGGAIAIGAQSVLSAKGIATRLQHVRLDRNLGQQYADNPLLAGLIVLGGIVDRDFVRELQAADLSFVIAGSHAKPWHANCVMADYSHGIEQAVSHLIAAGRQRIGLVNGPPITTSSAEKHRGFLLALSLHGLCTSPSQIVVCESFTSESGYAQTQQLLAQQPDLDAIVYASDTLAMGGLRSLKESDRQVPGDVAITGYYDFELACFTDPPLTTVHIDLQAMGSIAARRLCMMLEQPDDQAWCVTVPTSLVVREST